MSLSPVHLLPERGCFKHHEMHKNLAPMPNPKIADYLRDSAVLAENSKINKLSTMAEK